MKHLTWWTLPLAAAVLFGLMMADDADAGRKKGEKDRQGAKARKKSSGLRGEYAIMASQCNLTDEQKDQLEAKVQARKKALAEWDKAHSEKFADLKKAIQEAREAGNQEEAKRLRDQRKALKAERRRLDDQAMAEVYAVLTPDQQVTWTGFRLYRRAMRWYKRADLSEAQEGTIRKMADAAARQLADADDEKAEDRIVAALRKDIKQEVLTAGQREALEKKPEKPRGKKGKKDADRPKQDEPDAGDEG